MSTSKYLAGLTAALIYAATAAAAEPVVFVNVNNVPVQFSGVQPLKQNGSVMVPLRGVFQAMGATVSFTGATKTVKARKGDRTILLPLGSAAAVVNGRVVRLTQPAQVIGGTTLVPLRFVAQSLGAHVSWIAATSTVMISQADLISSETPAAIKAMAPVAADPALRSGWKVTLDDEFTGGALDTSKWTDHMWYGRENDKYPTGDYQFYGPSEAVVQNGHLRLIARNQHNGSRAYTSGLISSYGKFYQQYGWFEMCAKMPRGQGLWPAYWLMPENRHWPPEIDIVEFKGKDPNTVILTHHGGIDMKSHTVHSRVYTSDQDYTSDYHTYAVDWEPAYIAWYVDGVEQHRVTEDIPALPMYLIANLAVGGHFPGFPDATTPFPSTMDIKYIRVYSR